MLCTREPVAGRVRCEEHKGMRVNTFTAKSAAAKQMSTAFPKRSNTNYDTICGVVLVNGSLCTRKPGAGRVRCERHKGMRVN